MNPFGQKCPTEGVLLRALDEELPERTGWQVKLHLEGCERCQQRIEELRIISQRVSELAQDSWPGEGVETLAERMDEAESRGEAIGWFDQRAWRPLAWSAALGMLIALWLGVSLRQREKAVAKAPGFQPPAVIQQARAQQGNQVPASLEKHVPRASRKHSSIRPQSQPGAAHARETVTPFFALPFSDAALPLDQAVMIRVDLPRSALELAGLPVAADLRDQRVRADLVLGEDGLARAIRFVK